MRIRLRVLRNELPPTQLLFKVPDDPTSASKLLELVDAQLPLVSGQWGYEDYKVTVGDYELLHYNNLHDLLQQDDVVTSPSDPPKRNASGRWLPLWSCRDPPTLPSDCVDPPRKRRRIEAPEPKEDEEIEFADDDPEQFPALLLDRPHENDEDSEDDEDYEQHSDHSQDSQESSADDEDYEQHSDHSEDSQESSADDEDEDEDEPLDPGQYQYNPTTKKLKKLSDTTTKRRVSFSDTQEHPTHSDSELDVVKDVMPPAQPKPKAKAHPSTSQEMEIDYDQDSRPSDDSPSESDSSSVSSSSIHAHSDTSPEFADQVQPIPPKAKDTPKKTGAPVTGNQSTLRMTRAPGTGKKDTRMRNIRKTESRRLLALKRAGLLPKNVGRSALNEYDHQPLVAEVRRRILAKVSLEGILDEYRKPSSEANVAKSVERPTSSGSDQGAQEGGIVKGNTQEARLRSKSASEAPSGSSRPSQQSSASPVWNPDLPNEPVAKRSRLDVDSSRRLLFSSLGIRNPKNKEEEAELRKRLSETKRSGKVAPPADAQDNKSRDPDAWRAKIALTAHECHPDYPQPTTAPPFPFKQRWDTTQRDTKAKGSKRSVEATAEEESYFGAGEDGLEYDDAPAPTRDAQAPPQHLDDNAEVLDEASVPDLPDLPSDLSALPTATTVDFKPDAIIAYTLFECTAATHWQPKESPVRTALIHSLTDNTLDLELALRDRPRVKRDEHGQRIYEKHDAISLGDDDEAENEDGRVLVGVGELRRVWLVRAAGVQADGLDEVEMVERVEDSAPLEFAETQESNALGGHD